MCSVGRELPRVYYGIVYGIMLQLTCDDIKLRFPFCRVYEPIAPLVFGYELREFACLPFNVSTGDATPGRASNSRIRAINGGTNILVKTV